MRRIAFWLSGPLLLLLSLCGCRSQEKVFIPGEPVWSVIEIREDLDFDQAWNSTVELLVRTFDLDVINKDEGYLLTKWLYTWSGEYQEDYRVRVTLKLTTDGTRLVQLKPEAQLLSKDQWVIGTDTRLVSTLKSDLMGLVSGAVR